MLTWLYSRHSFCPPEEEDDDDTLLVAMGGVDRKTVVFGLQTRGMVTSDGSPIL